MRLSYVGDELGAFFDEREVCWGCLRLEDAQQSEDGSFHINGDSPKRILATQCAPLDTFQFFHIEGPPFALLQLREYFKQGTTFGPSPKISKRLVTHWLGKNMQLGLKVEFAPAYARVGLKFCIVRS